MQGRYEEISPPSRGKGAEGTRGDPHPRSHPEPTPHPSPTPTSNPDPNPNPGQDGASTSGSCRRGPTPTVTPNP